MKRHHLFCAAVLFFGMFLLATSEVHAQIQPDARLGLYTNGGNFSIGAGVTVPIKIPAFGTLIINPTVDYLFISGTAGSSATSIFGHADVAYQFDIAKSPISPYAGAGLLIAFSTVLLRAALLLPLTNFFFVVILVHAFRHCFNF